MKISFLVHYKEKDIYLDVFFFDLNQYDSTNTTFTMVNIFAIFHITFILTHKYLSFFI